MQVLKFRTISPFIIVVIVILSACSTANKQTKTIAIAPSSHFISDGKLFTAVWMQRSAEYKALCEQAYNIAAFRLTEYLSQPANNKPPAIVTDIDETVLDNSAYAVHQASQNKDFDNFSWSEWVNMAQADTIAGALSFFKEAENKKVAVFYVTNRDAKARAGTLKNLQKFGFPFADEEHLVTMGSSSSKESRRMDIDKKYNILLLLGDNLSDFALYFDKRNTQERTGNTLLNRNEFGKRFIILPNPNYGDWESALYNYNYKLNASQRDSAWRANSKNY